MEDHVGQRLQIVNVLLQNEVERLRKGIRDIEIFHESNHRERPFMGGTAKFCRKLLTPDPKAG